MRLKHSVVISFLVMFSLLLLNILVSKTTTQPRYIQYSDQNIANIATPEKYHRQLSSTLYSIPEWYLVFSPEEYANLLKYKVSSQFPFYDATMQYWETYSTVIDLTEAKHFYNPDEKIMLYVIGSSTTLEYVLRGIYEKSVGAISYDISGRVEEDDYSQKVAQNYVEFIKKEPWFEFDYVGALKGLWLDNSFFGKGFVRKVERKYILSTEYIAKAIYAKIIGYASHAKYGVESTDTATVFKFNQMSNQQLPYKQIKSYSADTSLVLLPRLDAYKYAVENLANKGEFISIAGNSSYIAFSIIANSNWQNDNLNMQEIFRQQVLTEKDKDRIYLVVPVNDLSQVIAKLMTTNDLQIEHIYDY
ncbi:hypothetical protein [Francisella philomiragia]|uniref:hypothetical protein n=1 Tax=Francisella philomiragia TaxID=28110 RepID=UPI00190802EE|nr:hypothetical protein [Francisella philomiragia]MBK2268311.1 hypothetical protein [Francisella philomiragia]MBK2279694.1 hypothetical protein [Francisella philomiragia]MBK2287622.1 hypothetical protein [Francisella philomiragia]MBK2289601.1 hypothetical protein [Francisella philomiragia]MBK2291499.1 hypothetical protein [Francisella philomiragia]